MVYLSRPFKALLEMLRTELSAIKEAVQDHAKAVRAAKEGKDKEQEIRQKWWENVLTEYKKAEGDRTTSDDRHYRIQNSLRWATWLAFIAAFVYATIAALQLRDFDESIGISQTAARESRIQAAASQRAAEATVSAIADNENQFAQTLAQMKAQTTIQSRSADAAKRAAKIGAAALANAQREAIIENGAALAIADLGFPKRDGGRVKWEWAFENYGKTPAVDVTVQQTIDVGTAAHTCWREGNQLRTSPVIEFPAPIFKDQIKTGYCIILTDEWSGSRTSEYDRRRAFKGGIKLNLTFRYSDAYGTYTMAICLENAGTEGVADGDVTPHAVFCNAPRRTEERPTENK